MRRVAAHQHVAGALDRQPWLRRARNCTPLGKGLCHRDQCRVGIVAQAESLRTSRKFWGRAHTPHPSCEPFRKGAPRGEEVTPERDVRKCESLAEEVGGGGEARGEVCERLEEGKGVGGGRFAQRGGER